MGHTVQQIAITFGVSRQAVESWLTVEEMPKQIKDAVKAGEVSATAALQLAGHSRDEQVRRFEELKQGGGKPTVKTMRSASASPDNKPAPKMKTRREIEEEIARLLKCKPQDADLWGRINALRWVIGEEQSHERHT
jgi:hypothetical protein